MSYRAAQIYIQSRTKQRLRLITRLFPSKDETKAQEREWATADEVADLLINEIIAQKYPAITQLEKDIAKLEADFAEKMKNG